MIDDFMHRSVSIAALALGTLLAAPALAEESNVRKSPRATVSLVSDHAAVTPGQQQNGGPASLLKSQAPAPA